MDRPVRKAIRLKQYDYSQNAAYFITVCTKNRQPLFWKSTMPRAEGNREMHPNSASGAWTRIPASLSETGEIVFCAIENIPSCYPFIDLEKYVIMPDHIHLLLRFDAPAETEGRRKEENGGRLIAAPTLQTVVGQLKRWASQKAGEPIWQKSFYEHVIRSQGDYREAWSYIDGNPGKYAEKRE